MDDDVELGRAAPRPRHQHRRRRDERGRHGAGRDGSPRDRPRPQRRQPVPATARGPRGGGRVRPGRRRACPAPPSSWSCPRPPRRTTPTSSPPKGEASRSGTGPGRSRAICARREAVAVAGTHGKTTTSALLATILTGAARAPGWIVGAAVPGLGRSATWGGGGPLVVEADESDGTFLALGASTRSLVTNVEPDHLEHWGGERGLREAFGRFVAAVPGPSVLCLDDPGAADLVPHAAEPVTYGTDPAADYVVEAVASQGTGVTFDLVHGDERVRVAVPAAPGLHNARNAAGALALAHRLGVPLAEGGGRAGRLPRRGAPLRGAGRSGRHHLRRQLRPPPDGGRCRAGCGPQPAPGDVWCAASSRTATAGPRRCGATLRRRVRRCRRPRDHRRVPRGRGAPSRCHRQAARRRRARRPPWRHVAWLPTLDDVVAYLRRDASARRPLPHPGRRRPHHRPGPAPRRSGRDASDRVTAIEAAAADGSARWPTATCRSGPLTTYRVGGRRRAAGPRRGRATRRGRAGAVAATGVDVLVVGKGSNLLVADAGFPGLALVLGDGFAGIDVDGDHRASRWARRPYPWSPAAPVPPGSPASSGPSACPGRSAGAVRMNAGGHGADLAAVARGGPPRGPAQRGGWVGARGCARPRLPPVRGPPAPGGGGGRAGPRCRRPRAGRRGDRRDRRLAAGEPARRPQRRLGVRQPRGRRGRPPHRRGRGKGLRHGTAEVSTKHANFIQADDGGRADDVFALMGEVHDLVVEATGVVLHARRPAASGSPSNPRLEVEG